MKKLGLFITCLSLGAFLFSCENDGTLIEEETLILDENSFQPKDLEVSRTNNERALKNLLEQNAIALLKIKKSTNISKETKRKILIDMLEQSSKKFKIIEQNSSKE